MRKFVVIVLLVVAAFALDAKGTKDTTATATSGTPAPAPTPPAAPRPPETERYFQTDAQIGYQLFEIIEGKECWVNGMSKYGCKFMSALGIAQTYAQKNLTAQQINTIREEAQSAGLVAIDMSTPNAAAVINRGFAALGCRLHAVDMGKVETLSQLVTVYTTTIVFGVTENDNPHYCEGDHEGNIVYNPCPTAVYRMVQGFVLIKISGYRTLDPLRSIADSRG